MTLATGPIEDGWVRCLHATDEALDAFLRLAQPAETAEETR